jgi:RNA polymerase sigma-54 factor
MKQSLSLRAGLSLTMTPALQQAIRLLQLSSLDLETEIEEALESNLMLEREGDGDGESDEHSLTLERESAPAERTESSDGSEELNTVVESTEIPEDMPVDAEWDDIYDGGSSQAAAPDDVDFLGGSLPTERSLREHLEWQAAIAPFDAIERLIAEHIIDAINEDGYLEDWDGLRQRLLDHAEVPRDAPERVLAAVQDFDPPGVAARDIAECLRLQLQQMSDDEPARGDALSLLELPMALLARRDPPALARAGGLAVEAVQQALLLIGRLQPHPGRPFQSESNDYVSPDVFVIRQEGRWRVSLNPEHTPRLRINSGYQSLIRRADSSRDQLTLKQHLQEARHFIHALEARNETLLRVAQCIVEEQRAFLEYGPEAMRPLVLRDIAGRLGIHESTVSRATAHKYMATPRGLFELKHFFSSTSAPPREAPVPPPPSRP